MLGLAFFATMTSFLLTILLGIELWIFYAVAVSFTFSFSTLAFILYKIAAYASLNTFNDKTEFKINDTDEELLNEDIVFNQ